MKILLASAELAPFAKIGGLADVCASLSKAWHSMDHEVLAVLPLYGSIDRNKYGLRPTEIVVSVPFAHWTEYAKLWTAKLPGTSLNLYFLENHEYFDRDGIYGDPDGFADNDRRFTFLTRAMFEVARTLNFRPDIVHAHDHHTALALPMLKITFARDPFFSRTAGVLTIHNMAFQGVFEAKRVMNWAGFGMKHFFRGSWFEAHGAVNMLKAGIMFADKVTTVSPTYAQEIRFTKYGEGLQESLNARSGDLIGVLNGADYDEWSPESDPFLNTSYSTSTISNKEHVKQDVLNRFRVPVDDLPNMPLFGMVSRLSGQKGIELLEQTMESFLKNSALRFVAIGTGEKRYEQFLSHLSRKFPGRAMFYKGYSNEMSHRVIAGSDFLLVPSLFEPCGLTQIYAMKYGTIPVVRSTGGLIDTVENYSTSTMSGVGIRFDGYNRQEFSQAIKKALSVYRVEPHWSALKSNAMKLNFSAELSARTYLDVFRWALEKVR